MTDNRIKVVILAGGYGTRLLEETSVLPKPMIEIGGYPLLWHLMKFFSAYEFNQFVIALGYKGEVIKRYFLDYSQIGSDMTIDVAARKVKSEPTVKENWSIDLVDTGLGTMTGGRIKRLRDKLTETFILTYGDGLSNVNLDKLLAFHQSHGKLATVTAVSPVSRFGILKLSENGHVMSFAEKPDNKKDLISGGFFVLEPEVIDYIDGDATSWEHEPCENLTKDGQMMAYCHEGFWQCVDTLYELKVLRNIWSQDKAAWKIWD